MIQKSVTALVVLCLSLTALPRAAAVTVFNYTAEYVSEPTPAAIGNDASNLNGSIGQIGLWSDTVESPSSGSQNGDSIFQFEDNPNLGVGGRVLWADRPEADTSFTANMSDTVFVDGATVQITIGTRRTQNGSNAKDYDLIGLDAGGQESFHLRVSANGAESRLGVITGGSTFDVDLETAFGMQSGDDNNGDLGNLGGPPFADGEIGVLTLTLGATSYTIDFDRQDGTNVYLTDAIPYNDTGGGTATQLSRIQFDSSGGADNASSGYIIDNFSVEGTLIPEPSSIALGLLGLFAMAISFRRRTTGR